MKEPHVACVAQMLTKSIKNGRPVKEIGTVTLAGRIDETHFVIITCAHNFPNGIEDAKVILGRDGQAKYVAKFDVLLDTFTPHPNYVNH